jgi:4'-phosphopantetheinyl transferase EntD
MMIADIIPSNIKAVEATDDTAAANLFPVEAAVLGRAVDARKREFTTARDCARRALVELGCPPAPILSGASREPVWPDGFVGSITHCQGYRAAAVARCGDYLSIGIDAEPHEPLPSGILNRIARPEELESLRMLEPGQCWDRLLFSAKESIYKLWFPIMRRWLGFEDAAVSFDPVRASFQARLFTQASIAGCDFGQLQGRFRVVNGFVLTFTGLAVPAERAA